MPNFKRKIAFILVNRILQGTWTWSFPLKRKLLNWGGVCIGDGTKVVGPLYVYGKLTVGKNNWIGKNLVVNGNGAVAIGDNCDIAPEVTFQTGGHKIGSHERRAGDGELYQQIIGSGVWIGGRSSIIGNVTIGDGSVVAACACVNKDVPPDVIVGGIPSKIIKEL